MHLSPSVRRGGCRVDGPHGADLGAVAAAGAGPGAPGLHGQAPVGLVGILAGHCQLLGHLAAVQALPDGLGKARQLQHVVLVGPAGGKLAQDGMLGHGGHRRHRAKARRRQGVPQLQQGVVIGPVAIHRHQDHPGPAAGHPGQPLPGGGGHPAPEGGHGHQTAVRRRKGGGGPLVQGPVHEVNLHRVVPQGTGEQVGHPLGAAGGTENQLVVCHARAPFSPPDRETPAGAGDSRPRRASVSVGYQRAETSFFRPRPRPSTVSWYMSTVLRIISMVW